MSDIFIIVGLGNPGDRYENTRHNVGFDAVEAISKKHGIAVTKLKHKALLGEGTILGKKVVLVKPQTYMNLSGESVREILSWYKADLQNTIIIYDDIDLSVGKMRIRPKGSSGTHNGMKSIIYQLQKDEFPRIRIGVDKPPAGWDLANFVLSKFSDEERKKVEEVIQSTVSAVEEIIKSGIDLTMNTSSSH
jgi:PTH1 family peptidyl-tRNA hydrolase